MRKLTVPELLIITACLVLIMLTACAGIESGRKIVPVSLQVTGRLELPFDIEKCLLDERSGTYYIWEKDSSNLMLYRNGQQINVIGGIGSDRSNFQKLSDIALDSDGNLLALDEFARLVRKFNPDGKWLADIELNGVRQPQKFCSTAESDLIIYDSATKELKRLSGFDGRTLYTFGRFQVDSVSHISANRDVIALVSETGDTTVLFSAMGLYLKDEPLQLVVDQYLNRFYYKDGALRLERQDTALPLGWQDTGTRLFSVPGSLLLVKDNIIVTVRPDYRNR
jgi:hypothetical protein